MRGGQPSMTTPTPPPCDSPKVVMRKSCPKVLPIAVEPNRGAQDSQRASEDGSGERTRPRVLVAVPRRNELSAGLEREKFAMARAPSLRQLPDEARALPRTEGRASLRAVGSTEPEAARP